MGCFCSNPGVLEVLHFEANNLVVREGTGIDFKLLLLSKSDYEFQWFHKEYEVTDASTRYRLYMSQMENGTSLLTLHIAKSLQRDEGVFTKYHPIFCIP